VRRAVAAALFFAVAACTDRGGSVESFCHALGEQEDLATTFQDFDPSDPEAALDQLRVARVALGELLDEAPDEVRDDLQVEIDYVQDLIDALEQVEPGDATEATLQVRAITDAHPDVEEAATELAAFADGECAAT